MWYTDQGNVDTAKGFDGVETPVNEFDDGRNEKGQIGKDDGQ
jgi:hypothetical protein